MKEIYQKFGPIIIGGLLLFFSYKIFKPFFIPLIASAVIAYMFYPIYRFLNEKTRKSSLSAVITIIIVFLLVVLPASYILGVLIKEIPGVYRTISTGAQNFYLVDEFTDRVYEEIGVSIDIRGFLTTLFTKTLVLLQNTIILIPSKIFNMFILGIFLFYLLKEGHLVVKNLTHLLPFGKSDTKNIFLQIKYMTDAIIYGQLITAIIQGILATLIYSILGIKSALFWGIVTLFFSVIPMLGPAIVYWPLSIILIVTDLSSGNGPFRGLFLLGFSIAIISSVDNVVKPLVIGDKVNMHPMLVMISMFGGLSAFGVIGLILGPILLIVIMTLLKTYHMKEELIENEELIEKVE